MKLTEKQKLWLRGQADIIVECLPEDIQIEGNALASGDELEDKRQEKMIRDQLESGNEWAWCCIKVTLSWRGFEGTDFLGCCSYKSKRDFQESDGYFPDMVSVAFDELVKTIESDMDAFYELISE